ncbi:hypothetical protein TNCT_495361 [Trichonephila clavata]|uniref:Uncharacterized protein n=1 Tax=Trichonephila clavata TaxID=2740835 RepID=A0A8X6L5R9_TRICU|nr:hypothetical protein TNCT_495361 [Trichonephila clavata]
MKLKFMVSPRNQTPVRDGKLRRGSHSHLNMHEQLSRTSALSQDMALYPTSRSYIFTLNITKALEVFHNLPSDIESDESSLSEEEDIVTESHFQVKISILMRK